MEMDNRDYLALRKDVEDLRRKLADLELVVLTMRERQATPPSGAAGGSDGG